MSMEKKDEEEHEYEKVKKKEKKNEDAEELQQVLKVVSEQVPAMIRGIIGSIFSAEAGKNTGAAAGNYYKELKASGIPDDVAVKMTQEYTKTFSDLGSLIKEAMGQKGSKSEKSEEKKD